MPASTAAAIIGSSVLGAGASLLGSKKQSDAAEKAGDATAAATRESIEEQRRQFDLARGDILSEREELKPMRDLSYQDALGSTIYGDYLRGRGVNALSVLADIQGLGRPGKGGTHEDYANAQQSARNWFETSPGYEFRRDEGIKAAQNSAAARGLLSSGGTVKGIQRFGDGLAASEWDSHVNRLFTMAGLGSGAPRTSDPSTGLAGQAANVAMQGGQSIGNALMAGGNARASSYLAQGNAQAQGIAGIGSAANSGIQNALLLQYLNRVPTTQLPRA